MYKLQISSICTAIWLICTPGASAADKPALRLVQTIDLPGVEGRFDHFAMDVKGQRLFIAALGNNTLEVLDLKEGKRIKSVAGLKKPTGAAYIAETGELAIASGDDNQCRFIDTRTWEVIARVENLEDADNVRYDPAAKRIYVGCAAGALAVIDVKTHKLLSQIKLDAHPESFQLELGGPRIFVNVPDAGQVAVIDREKGKTIARWALKDAAANFPMALDEKNRRLFIACRKPARLLALDTDTGTVVAKMACAGDADDLFFDAERHRIYIAGGEGVISVIEQSDADHYRPLDIVKTAPGARTCYFSGELSRVYLAVPHRGGQKAEIRVLEVEENR